MSSDNWKPSASISTLKQRADLFGRIRQYFDEQNVMEVDTPMLSASATVDLHIDSFVTTFLPIGGGKEQSCYLHTSPEFPMKRLLAAGSGDIYSLGRVFRNGEAGGRHNPEFTMLEYYRVGMNQHQLMDDMSELLSSVADFKELARVSYGHLFQEYFGINPHLASDEELARLVREKVDSSLDGLERNDCLDLLFSNEIEPGLGKSDSKQLNGVYVYDYPASMAALARLHTNEGGEQVAARFELFINGVELANGYHELTNAQEQHSRFQAEQDKRRELGRPVYPYDQRLVEGLKSGMPDCAGVAMGLDRLLMLMLDKKKIADVIAFDFSRA
ncbi:EF-P lysine aminoacylase EpmA [Endozoicomonas arenosclerae]|uniref:EF-P lysine aminoacylase EpmA n=1 Tax=Endozoicomonas arenosclerae TaxID=1633495 RepID=UPI0007855350|nr:EF-P lysine aminoacylase EpmA [Endozoicomonas arenosclerae]